MFVPNYQNELYMAADIAVIFDMDGVIIHSNPLITKAWRKFFSGQNIELTDEQLNHYVFGRTSADTIKLVFKKELPVETLRKYQHIVETYVQQLYVSEGVLTSGFKPFVEELIARGIPVAIATAAPPENVKVVLEMSNTQTLFPVITNANDVHQSKPHPEVYLTTAAKLGVAPTKCVVFEDSFSGIASAKAAGMKVIGITTTHTYQELSTQTDAVINDFMNVNIEMIRRLPGCL